MPDSENRSADNKPAENKPAENKSAENKPAENKPAENKPADKKPAESKPADKKPADKKPAESKPADKKPAENKPAAKKPDKQLKPEEAYAKAEQFLLADGKITDKSFRPDNFKTAAKYFKQAGDYKDAGKKAEECLKAAEEARKDFVEDYYQEGIELMNSAKTPDNFETARKRLLKVKGYKDADALIGQCEEKQEALYLKNAKKARLKILFFAALIALVIIFVNSPLWDKMMVSTFPKKEAAETGNEHGNGNFFAPAEAEPGDKITFGVYDWRVLEKDGNELLLIMSGAEKHKETGHRAYNDKFEDTTWADCTLREWLNGEFLENGFSEEERGQILSETVQNPDNKDYGTKGGEDTEDKVTLLTAEMYEQYFEQIKFIAMNFWLRGPGNTQQAAQFVSHRKVVMSYGYAVDSDQFFVVPVMRIAIPDENK